MSEAQNNNYSKSLDQVEQAYNFYETESRETIRVILNSDSEREN